MQIYDSDGELLKKPFPSSTVAVSAKPGFDRFCSAEGVKRGVDGFEDDILFAGEHPCYETHAVRISELPRSSHVVRMRCCACSAGAWPGFDAASHPCMLSCRTITFATLVACR
jgi:hypothetical protein